jgi:3'(2'), 5'-bisphosphate nucleotidase
VNDHELAAWLATEAGRLLLDVRTELADAPASERKEQGDRRSHEFLMTELANARPSDAVLSEEGADDPARLSAERVWIVDPLDGTREFSELEDDPSDSRRKKRFPDGLQWHLGMRGGSSAKAHAN